jgi:hypothetical protein
MTEKELQVIDAEVVITPMTLIQKAQEKDASIEQMQQLFDLQLRWEENEAKKAFHKAVSAFKSESITILKDKHVSFDTRTGKTEYDHATLGRITATVIPVLSKHGLSHRWSFDQPEGRVEVTCILSHELGYSEECKLSAAKDDSGGKNPIQAVSSTVSYLERYTFLGVTGLAAIDQDNDGKGADPDPVDVINECQLADLDALIDEVKANRAAFLTTYGVDSLEFFPLDMLKHACKSLNAKRKS